jgi:PTS system N-acetylgalactosamine-specific IIA component
VSAVDAISGNGDVFIAVSNAGMSGADIETALRRHVAESGVKVFFTDLPGGSATLAVRRMMHSNPELVLITGSNLATLLEFSFQVDGDPRDSAKRAAEKGRSALAAFGGA